MNFKKLLESLVLVALATVGIAGAASLHTGSARQQMDTSVLQTMLSPLLTKYQIHEPLAYTDEGLKDTLEAIQSKIVEEFRSLESVFDRRISKAVSSQALKKNASAGDAGGNHTAAERLKVRNVKALMYQKQMAQRHNLEKIVSRAEAIANNADSAWAWDGKGQDAGTQKYQSADAELGLAEVSMDRIVSTQADVKKWTKDSLLKNSMLFAKVLASDEKLAEFLDSLNNWFYFIFMYFY